MSLNKILLIGNVGRDPEMRYTPSGSAVTSFTMAVNRRYTTRDGQQQEETEWFRVVAWERLADQVNQYVTKGQKVYVEGRLRSQTFQGNDGQTRFVNEVNAQSVLFLDRPGSAPWQQEQQPAARQQQQSAPPYYEYDYGDTAGAPSDAEDLPW
ncbi:MAG: single-stranded DNA-binding protein [Chloroflexota bacterium]